MFLWAFGLGLHGPLPSTCSIDSLGRPIRDPQDTRFLSSLPFRSEMGQSAGYGRTQGKRNCFFTSVDLRAYPTNINSALGWGGGSRWSK
ncbi:hypothetical protein V8C40DRAFT_255817 [Trichoderma camerunense]